MTQRNLIINFYLILIGVLASAIFFYVNQRIGISHDSAIYLEGAESIRNGNGFYVIGAPMAVHAPLYPFLLALLDPLNNNIVQTARLFSAFLFGVNIILIGVAVHICTKRSIIAPSLAILLFICSPYLFIIQTFAWSESLFFTLSLCGCILLAKYISQQLFFYFLLASICLGMATITRYAGIALILPSFIIF